MLKRIERWLNRLDCTAEGMTQTGTRFRLSFSIDDWDGKGDIEPVLRERVRAELKTGFVIERWSVERSQ